MLRRKLLRQVAKAAGRRLEAKLRLAAQRWQPSGQGRRSCFLSRLHVAVPRMELKMTTMLPKAAN